jgi:hypothetical protein
MKIVYMLLIFLIAKLKGSAAFCVCVDTHYSCCKWRWQRNYCFGNNSSTYSIVNRLYRLCYLMEYNILNLNKAEEPTTEAQRSEILRIGS